MPDRYDKGSPPAEEDFTGHVKDDATGLHYAGARYYSAALASWTTTEPLLQGKWPKKILKEKRRLLTMSSYNYSFDNPVTLTDPTGLAPTDWYRDEDGEIKYDEDVQSQADLEVGQTYLGENVLQYQEDGPTRLGTEGGDWVNVFDESTTRAEAGAIGASKTSISATPVSSLLSAESVSGGKALSGLKTGTKVFGRSLSGVGADLSIYSEFAESEPFGASEKVKIGVETVSFAGSFTGIGTVVNVAAELTPAGSGMFVKERGIRFLTRQILEARVDQVVSR
jgi:RHS repeat-associated protein